MITEVEVEKRIELIETAIKSYEKLIKREYIIVLGHKNKLCCVDLVFYPSAFFHLTGLNKLSDLSFRNDIKKSFFREIRLNSNLRRRLVYSKYFDKIVNRLQAIIELENNFSDIKSNLYVKFVHKPRGEYLSIDYSFFIRSKRDQNNFHYFLRNLNDDANNNLHLLISSFIENKKDYSREQEVMKLVKKILIDIKTGKETIIFTLNDSA